MTDAPPGIPERVTAAIAAYPEPAKSAFLTIRDIVLQAAASQPVIGPLTETLKWGEPAYLTEATNSGSTLRIAWKQANPDRIGVFLNCSTRLVETMRSIYPETFEYEGNRGLHMALDAPLPTDPLDHCARLALTYHISHEKFRRHG